ncbi:MAG: hypothetical protein XD50_0666 [Clostridia bacterium 41_269]|nr:MAG: hypothetical protein XD50_0666 [Clostridia bacterium 41_269]
MQVHKFLRILWSFDEQLKLLKEKGGLLGFLKAKKFLVYLYLTLALFVAEAFMPSPAKKG